MRKGTALGKMRLAERLILQLRKGKLSIQKELGWNKLYGLGKGLWKGEDAKEYVNRLRDDRI